MYFRELTWHDDSFRLRGSACEVAGVAVVGLWRCVEFSINFRQRQHARTRLIVRRPRHQVRFAPTLTIRIEALRLVRVHVHFSDVSFCACVMQQVRGRWLLGEVQVEGEHVQRVGDQDGVAEDYECEDATHARKHDNTIRRRTCCFLHVTLPIRWRHQTYFYNIKPSILSRSIW